MIKIHYLKLSIQDHASRYLNMSYTFEILGVSPVLHFFNHQQERQQKQTHAAVEYIASYQCTLDAIIRSVETVAPKRDLKLDQAVETIIDFWVNNSDIIDHWKRRLVDAGHESLLVSRLADFRSLKAEFETLLL